MGKPFFEEINSIPDAIQWALSLSISNLKRSIEGMADCNLLTIGSGGSSTATAFLALIHEAVYKRLSRSTTPGELLTLPPPSRQIAAVLLSAEGKNRDILAAARHVAMMECPATAVVLNDNSPLSKWCCHNSSISISSYAMPWEKDGYLATKSLIATMILLARAYGLKEIEQAAEINSDWVKQRTEGFQILDRPLSRGHTLSVLYSGAGRIGAIDIESKLAESNLGSCELVDYRQFAHGRHIKLRTGQNQACFLAFSASDTQALSDATLSLFPSHIPVVRRLLPTSLAYGSLVSVIDAILLTARLGQIKEVDPGQPFVPKEGRALHHLDVTTLLPFTPTELAPIHRKSGRMATSSDITTKLSNAGIKACETLEKFTFKALVCDFDGTFCNTDCRYNGVDARLLPDLERLLSLGLDVAFATGRGGSLYEDLQKKLPPILWPKVLLGLYSGSMILPLTDKFTEPEPDTRLTEMICHLHSIGLNLSALPDGAVKLRAGQASIRCEYLQDPWSLFTAVQDWIHTSNLNGWRICRSGHSMDILTDCAGKLMVVKAIAERTRGHDLQAVLRIGDAGQQEGNDFELLASPYGLSVDRVSPEPAICWNLLPAGFRGVVGTRHYLQAIEPCKGGFRLSLEYLARWKAQFTSRVIS